ncbi:MAG: integrase [Halioglobus sp.]|jgi:integrase
MLQLIDENLLSTLEFPAPKQRDFYSDTVISGFQLRVYGSGKVGLYLNYRVKSGEMKGAKRSYHLINPSIENFRALPVAGKKAAMKKWRGLAEKYRGEVDGGGDPAADRATARAKVQKIRKKKAKKQAKAVEARKAEAFADKNTIAKLCADNGKYYTTYLKPSTNGGERTRDMLLTAYSSLADLPITAITNDQVRAIEERWIVDGDIAASSIDRYRSTLRAFCNWCITAKILANNPCDGIKRVAKPFDYKRPYKAFDVAEVKALYAELNCKVAGSYKYPDYFRVMVPLAINTGMRRGEILKLDWSLVRPDSIDLPETKNGKSHNVKMNKTAAALIQDWRNRQGVTFVSGKVFDPELPPKNTESKSDRLTNQVKYLFKKLTKAAGIKAGFHATRHTFAATLARNGVSIHLISQMLNHSSLEITMRYAREYQEHLNQAKVLDGMFG